ncbi:hypothetical protein ACJX0J_022113, partial [Zea mays]
SSDFGVLHSLGLSGYVCDCRLIINNGQPIFSLQFCDEINQYWHGIFLHPLGFNSRHTPTCLGLKGFHHFIEEFLIENDKESVIFNMDMYFCCKRPNNSGPIHWLETLYEILEPHDVRIEEIASDIIRDSMKLLFGGLTLICNLLWA